MKSWLRVLHISYAFLPLLSLHWTASGTSVNHDRVCPQWQGTVPGWKLSPPEYQELLFPTADIDCARKLTLSVRAVRYEEPTESHGGRADMLLFILQRR